MAVRSLNQKVSHPILDHYRVSLHIKREDRLHPLISGNKYRKLKYNLSQADTEGHTTLLTFGGAYSNHIVATAAAGAEKGFRTIGVIRGNELEDKWKENPSLRLAAGNGMQFKFVSRETYRKRNAPSVLGELQKEFGPFYLLPEGGTNTLAVKGCREILGTDDALFDVVCCAVGTGGTLAGIINTSNERQKVMGFPALKGDFLKTDIRKFATKGNWELRTDYHFGGYAKINRELVGFINQFKNTTGIPLDPIYTGKMLFGIFDMVQSGVLQKNTKVLAIHTGGLQGIMGMNQRLKSRGIPCIDL